MRRGETVKSEEEAMVSRRLKRNEAAPKWNWLQVWAT